MKTLICQEPGKMEIIEQEKPEINNQGDVLISIKRIGICGTDIHAYGGNQPFFQYPRILGHELSGIIAETGSAVSSVAVGDKVTVIPYMHCGTCIACESGKTNCCTNIKVVGVHIDGGMKDFLVVPEKHVLKVNSLSLNQAAIIEPLSIGAHAIRRAEIKPEDTVLVIGAGPIGLGVAAFAKTQDAKTIVMDISEKKLKLCKSWAGCDEVIVSDENNEEKLRAINNGNLPSIVLDATGNKLSMMNAFNYVSHGGKLIYVGLVKDDISFDDPNFHSKELTLMGSRNATYEDFQYVIERIENGEINADDYITYELSFNDTVEHFHNKNHNTNKSVIVLE
ncbi:zinc-binding alcohol dehydrogenase family protein [Metabacillus arenae]|uniref:Zinc-binding alcohol dehydrogenase family protein n=1 Tax=Metabacillus arenae TaxID=2771434 RepID=A0A926NLI1_9BACI|nr:zinc-binding alcohol dehydrogenase family protein [Metabacillus arenae]MBD1383275.1 zinc-binding alcohol dehydrogenase family protein [Metabacillus arenae]